MYYTFIVYVVDGRLVPKSCPPGSSGHWITQARILDCFAISFSRGCFQPHPSLLHYGEILYRPGHCGNHIEYINIVKNMFCSISVDILMCYTCKEYIL